MRDERSLRFDFLDKQIVDCDGHPFGRCLAAVSSRLRPPRAEEGPTVLDVALVGEAGAKVELNVSFDELENVAPLEGWLARHVVGRIPGADGAGE